jgi:hypothetical protein
MASDHLTEIMLSNVDGVLDGDLDQFMIAMLLQLAGDPSMQKKDKAAPGPEDEV